MLKLNLNLKIVIVILLFASPALAQSPYNPDCLNNPYGAVSPYKPDGLMNDSFSVEPNYTEEKNGTPPMHLALNCMTPIKPLLPLKPIWCGGTWTLILHCDQRCNCQWVPTCLE